MTEEIRALTARSLPLLVEWYAENRRELPWREGADPYRVWISEIMLQQTRIEAVRPYYQRFLAELPSVEALAGVEDDRLMKLWEGLGYYSRARNLKKAALLLMERHGGALPADVAALRALPGVGEYTAGAIASIAFGLPEPAVDGNVLRVLSRLWRLEEDILRQKTRRDAAALLRSLYPVGRDAGELTSALMELGEVICLPHAAPRCSLCPLRELCRAHADGAEKQYPVKSAKKQRREEHWDVFLLRCGEKFALEKRPGKGLLASLWGFPMALSREEAALLPALREAGLPAVSLAPCGHARHIFTHVEWEMTGYLADCTAPDPRYRWESADTIRRDYAIPTAFRPFLLCI